MIWGEERRGWERKIEDGREGRGEMRIEEGRGENRTVVEDGREENEDRYLADSVIRSDSQ